MHCIPGIRNGGSIEILEMISSRSFSEIIYGPSHDGDSFSSFEGIEVADSRSTRLFMENSLKLILEFYYFSTLSW